MQLAMLGVLAAVVAWAAQATSSNSATYVAAADILSTLKQMPGRSVSDRQIRMVDAGGYNVGVGVVHRPQAASQSSIEHDKLTEVYYVLEGVGTLVTGGTLVDAKPVAPTSVTFKELTGPSSIGTAIQAGQSRRIAPGDVVIIPAGVPHWFSDVQGSIKYLVIRVDPERRLATK